MKSSKSSFTFKSFEDLKALLEKKPFSFPEHHKAKIVKGEVKSNPKLEEELFKEAMEGVTPISRDKYVERIFQIELPEGSRDKEDAEILGKLDEVRTLFARNGSVARKQGSKKQSARGI